MKLFQDHSYDLRNAFPAKPGKRFVSFFIDFALVFFASALIFLGVALLCTKTSSYQNATAKVQDEISYYNDYAKQSHLVELVDGERKDQETMALENLNRYVNWSYTRFENTIQDQYPDFRIDPDSVVASYGEATIESDSLAYFYTTYIPKEAEESSTPIIRYQTTALAYVNELYRSTFPTGLFNYDAIRKDEDGNPTELPALYPNVAYSIYTYFTSNDTNSNSETVENGKGYFYSFYNAYSTLLTRAENLLVQNEPYYTEHYLAYKDAIATQARVLNVGLILTVLVSFLLLVLLPKFLFHNEKTIGRAIMSLGVVDQNGDAPKWYFTLLQSLIGFFPYLSVMVVLYLLPPFNGVFDGMMLPFIGSLSLTWVLVGLAFLALINSVSSFFTKDNATLLEMAFQHRLMDEKSLGN